MIPFVGEIVGTMILIIFGAGVVANTVLNRSKAEGSGWIVVTFGWGLGVASAIYAVGQISDAHINPAVTVGLAVIGEFPWGDVPLYIVAQMIGACIGAVIVFFHFFPHWKETENPSLKLAVFSTDPAIPHTFSNLISEIIGTAVLLIGLLAIGSQEFTEGLNPFIVGFYIIAIGLSLGGTTGYAINPARDLGPRIAHFLLPIHGKGPSNWTYSWIPVVGPFLGGSFGAVTYQALFNQLITIEFWIVTLLLVVVLITTFFLGKNGTQAIPGGDDIQN